jgi:DNA-binding HxlR family transcriptional regulator
MASQGGQLGAPILRCLAEEWTVPVLRELSAGSLRPSELEERLPRAPHAALTRRLRDLRISGVLIRERSGGLSPQAEYTLSDSGRALMAIPEAAERWGRNWSRLDSGRRPAARLALRLTADEKTRTILLALADGPLRPAALDERLPQIGRSAARDRVSQLHAAGILKPVELDGHPRSSLTPNARRLALIGMLAARWERQWPQEGEGTDSDDLPGLLRLLAPVVQIPEPVAGVCQLRIASDEPGQDVYLVADRGRLTALQAVSAPPEAVGWAPPEAWYDALLHRRLAGIRTSGDVGLIASVLASVANTLASEGPGLLPNIKSS